MLRKPTLLTPNNFLVWLLVGILFLTPFLRWETLFDAAGLPRYAFIGISSCMLFITWVFVQFRNSHSIIFHSLIFLLLAYLGWASLSYLWSVDPAATRQSLLYLSAFLILMFVTMQISRDTESIGIIIITSVIAGTLISLLGLLQVLGFEPFNLHQFSPPASTFGNKNHAAQYLDLIVPLSLFLFFTIDKRAGYWLASIALGINLAYLLNTYSRGSWLAITVAFLVLCYLLIKNQSIRRHVNSRIKQRKLPLALAISIVVLFFVIPGTDTSPRTDDKFTMNSSIHIRLKSYANAAAAFADSPAAGLGHSAFMLGYRKYMFANAPLTETTESLYLVNLHNDFLQEFVELGIVGGVFFLVFYLWLLLLAAKNTFNKSVSISLYSMGILLALIAFGVHALVSFPFHRPTSAMEFWVLAGIMLGLEGKKYTFSNKLAKSANIILAVCIPLLLVYSVYYYSHYFKNSQDLLRLKDHLVSKNCVAALNTATQLDYKLDYYTKIFVPLAYNYCYKTDPQESFTRMNEIITYDPDSSIARITRGLLLLDMERPQQAAQDFLNVAEVLPHRPTAYVGLGHAALNMGKTPLAVEMYQKALSLDEGNLVAQDMLQQLEVTKQVK